jgi:hypothetical protein
MNEENKMNDEYNETSVSLIASGYEWTCPNCDTLNKEIEVTEKVFCDNCANFYNVEEYNHALE